MEVPFVVRDRLVCDRLVEEFEQGPDQAVCTISARTWSATATTTVRSTYVLTGNCKHLGAHLGYGGKVVGDCIHVHSMAGATGTRWQARIYAVGARADDEDDAAAVVSDSRAVWRRVHVVSPHGEAPAGRHRISSQSSRGHRHSGQVRSLVVSGVLGENARTERPPADRRRKRPGQCTFPLRSPRHRHPGLPQVEIQDNEWQFLTGWPT